MTCMLHRPEHYHLHHHGSGGGGGMSANFLVEAQLNMVGGWRSAGRMEGEREKCVEGE